MQLQTIVIILIITLVSSHSLYNTHSINCIIPYFSLKMKLAVFQIALTCASVSAFAPNVATSAPSTTKLSMVDDDSSRRSFFNKVVGSTAVVGLSLLQSPFPANAIGGGINKVNAKLSR